MAKKSGKFKLCRFNYTRKDQISHNFVMLDWSSSVGHTNSKISKKKQQKM